MRKRILAFVLCLTLTLGIAGLEPLQANAASVTAQPTTTAKPKTTTKRKYYSNGIKLPYSNKFEFKKAAIRRTFNPSKDGLLDVTLQKTRFVGDDLTGKIYVKLYYKNKRGKWISPKGYYHTVTITSKSTDYTFTLNAPKGREFRIRLVNVNHKGTTVKGRLIIKDWGKKLCLKNYWHCC